MTRLEGKTALITGAGRNIGRAVALSLAQAGMNVVINGSSDRAAAEAVAAEARVKGVGALVAMGDVGSPEDCHRIAQEAIAAFGAVDVLVNNAALRPQHKFLELTPAEFRRGQPKENSKMKRLMIGLVLAALLPAGETRVAAEVGARLKLSNVQRIRLVAAVQPAGSAPHWEAAYAHGGEAVIDRLLIAGDAMAAVPLIGWHRPRPPATGKDIIARGVAPGPEVAKRLGAFERAWVAAGFPNDTETVAALLDAAAQS